MIMKLLLSLFLVITTSFSFAQGNLEFNGVLTYSGTLNFSNNNSSQWTVPTGKVWKIESMTTNSQFVVSTGAEIMYFNLNNVKIKKFIGNDANITYRATESPTPLWLKSGDVIQFTSNTNVASNYSCNYFISIVEFNFIQ